MTRKSLDDVIRAMAARAEALPGQPDETLDILSEVAVFRALDPVLATLYKQYLDIRGQQSRDQAMAAMIRDQAVSMACAIETRLIELRADAAFRRKAEDLITAQKSEQSEADAQAARESQAVRHLRIARQARQQNEQDNIVWLFAALWLMKQAFAKTQPEISLALRFQGPSRGLAAA